MRDERNPQEIEELRTRLHAIREAGGYSWAKLAPMIGLPSGTLTPWAAGKYAGDNSKIAEAVARFIAAFEKREAMKTRVLADPGFLETPTAMRFLDIFHWAQSGEMVAIAATPGTGKTRAAEEHRERASNVWIATARPSAAGLQPFQLAVCDAMALEENRSNPQQLSARIIGRMKGSRGLLIVDEAQELSDRALDEARSWHDSTGIGIAFIGDERVVGRLGGVRARQLARIHSRISMRHVQNGPLAEDAAIVCQGWGIVDPALVKRLQSLSQKPGGLRGVAKVIKLASLIASGEEREIELSDIDGAWRQLGYEVAPFAEGRGR